MKQEKRKQAHMVSFMNPGNLQKQIDSYGYHFSMGKYMISVMGSVLGAGVCGVLFSLKWYWIMVVAVVMAFCLPGLVLDGYKNMYEHKRFLDVTDYMEQMMYSFQMNHKILSALKDTKTMFPEGKMGKAMEATTAYLEGGVYEKDLYGEAFAIIEKEYPNRRVKGMHEYLKRVEKSGGDCQEGILLLLADKDIWADNTLLLQEDKKAARVRVLFALVITVGLALVFHGVYRAMPMEYSIVAHPITQVITALYLCSSILIFARANREIAQSWIEREVVVEKDKMYRYQRFISEYNETKEQRKSMLTSLPFLVASFCFGIAGKVPIAGSLFVLGLFLLNQHKIGYQLAYQRVVREINLCFPQWLMEMSLLLQGNNVQVAIEKTITNAPAVLQEELKLLSKRLLRHPDSVMPYMKFFEKFPLSGVQAAMKMLYSISEAGNGDIKNQIRVMVQRNNKLLDKSEKAQNEKSLTGISTIFYLPQLTVSLQMMTNMVVFMLVFFTHMKLN
ncbi:MAG: hypothetical protein RR139_10860 [Lachnospiraceae bacterium]